MARPHKHAEVFEAWEGGAIIQISGISGEWFDIPYNLPMWLPSMAYRVKPNGDQIEAEVG